MKKSTLWGLGSFSMIAVLAICVLASSPMAAKAVGMDAQHVAAHFDFAPPDPASTAKEVAAVQHLGYGADPSDLHFANVTLTHEHAGKLHPRSSAVAVAPAALYSATLLASFDTGQYAGTRIWSSAKPASFVSNKPLAVYSPGHRRLCT